MNRKLRILPTIIGLIILLLLPLQAGAAYTREDQRIYIYQQRLVVENISSQPVINLKVTVPVMFPDPFSNQFILDTRWNRSPSAFYRNERGSLTANYNIPRLEPGENAEIILGNLVQNFGVSFDLSSPGTSYLAPHPSYLQPEALVESNHPDIISKAKEITAGKRSDIDKAMAIFAFVQQYMNYSDSHPQRNKGALSALQHRYGVCEDYAALFVALCRSSGIPARMIYGQSSIEGDGEFFEHAWAEFFLLSHGWVPVEPTVISSEVPWNFFASLPGYSRHLAFSIESPTVYYEWFGGRISASMEWTIKESPFVNIFSDLDYHWARPDILALADKGAIQAEQGLFYPGKTITRGEIARMLVLAKGIAPQYGPSAFYDVRSEDFLHPYIQAAGKAGLFAGFEDGSFRPNEFITREQMAAVLSRIKNFNGEEPDFELTFADSAKIAPWAISVVKYSVSSGLFVGDTQNRFRPKDYCSRAEAAVLINRLIR